MKKIARSVFISMTAFYVVAQLLPGISWGNKMENLLLLSFAFALVALFVRPFLKTILLPFNMISFGTLGALINFGIIYALSLALPFFTFGAFYFEGAQILGFMIPAFNSSPLLTAGILSGAVSCLSALLYYLLS